MAVASEIKPSAEARQLYSRMVARAGENLVLDVEQAVVLGVERGRRGEDPKARIEINELVREEWIEAGEGGAWILH